MTQVKYEITDDLRLHVWNVEDDASTVPPFYYQNEHPDGSPWQSREQVETYLQEYAESRGFEVV